MKELYWIERLDSIEAFFTLITILSSLWLFYVCVIPTMCSFDKEDYQVHSIYKSRKIAGSFLATSVLILTFLPSTKEMYYIIGFGGTIDYIHQHEAAKKLPDKCIKALELFMDKATEDNNDNKKFE